MIVNGDYHQHHTENLYIQWAPDDTLFVSSSGKAYLLHVAALLKLLVISFRPEKIYQVIHKDPMNGLPDIIDLLVIMTANNERSASELFLDTSPAKDLRVRCVVYPEALFLHKLKEAPIYYNFYCTPENLVYSNNLKQYPFADEIQITSFRENAYPLFLKRMTVVQGFLNCAEALLSRPEDPRLAGFFIHQAAETLYRHFTSFLDGHETESHCIRALRNRIGLNIPQLQVSFPDISPEDKRMLDLLNDCYNKCRYDDRFQINRTDLDMLFFRTEQLAKAALKIMENLLGKSEQVEEM